MGRADDLLDHLPGFRLFDPYVTREIRIRDLLCHRSGLPPGEMLWYYSNFDRREILPAKLRSDARYVAARSLSGDLRVLAATVVFPFRRGA